MGKIPPSFPIIRGLSDKNSHEILGTPLTRIKPMIKINTPKVMAAIRPMRKKYPLLFKFLLMLSYPQIFS